MSQTTRKIFNNAYEMRNGPYRVRICMELGVMYFAAVDIAMVCGTSEPYSWVRKLSNFARPSIKCVKLKYPVLTKSGIIRRCNADFVNVDDAKRITQCFPVHEEMKNWLLNDVLTFTPSKSPALISSVESVNTPNENEESIDYEKQIDEIIMELLEIKRSIKMKNKIA